MDCEPHLSQEVEPRVRLVKENFFELRPSDFGTVLILQPAGNQRHDKADKVYQDRRIFSIDTGQIMHLNVLQIDRT